jgi:RNase P subunit RPR2
MEKIMYCVKCRAKREGKNKKTKVVEAINRKILTAECEKCGTKMVRMGVQQ